MSFSFVTVARDCTVLKQTIWVSDWSSIITESKELSCHNDLSEATNRAEILAQKEKIPVACMGERFMTVLSSRDLTDVEKTINSIWRCCSSCQKVLGARAKNPDVLWGKIGEVTVEREGPALFLDHGIFIYDQAEIETSRRAKNQKIRFYCKTLEGNVLIA